MDDYDDKTFVWCGTKKTIKKTSKYFSSFLISVCISFKGTGEMVIITLTFNAHVYSDIQNNFLIPSIENWFGDDEANFQEDNASCHNKGDSSFSSRKPYKINDMTSKPY